MAFDAAGHTRNNDGMPPAVDSGPPPAPTIVDVLQAIAAAGGTAWFPADFAAKAAVPRADLNGPLNELRLAGLIEVVDWARGRGQGYGLTAAGRKELNVPGPVVPEPPKAREIESNPAKLTPLERGDRARDALLSPRPALVTPVLVVVIVLWFLAGVGVSLRDGTGVADYLRGENTPALVKLGAVTGPHLLRGEWWRLGSCLFVHIGLVHIAVNLFALLSVGPRAEALWGRWRFLLIYFGGGLAGAVVAMASRPDTALAGASGAVWAVLASVVAWLTVFGSHFPPELLADLGRRLGIAVAVNVLISLAPGVSWEAHLGGGVAGFCIALLTYQLRPGTGWRALVAAAALLFLPLAFAAGLKRAIDHSSTWAPIRYRDDLRRQLEQSPARTVTLRVPIPPYPRVTALFTEATFATLRGVVEPTANVRARVGQMKAEAVAARGALDRLGPAGGDAAALAKTKAYLDALIPFLSSLEEMTDPDAKPDPSKAAARGKLKKDLEAAWAALTKS